MTPRNHDSNIAINQLLTMGLLYMSSTTQSSSKILQSSFTNITYWHNTTTNYLQPYIQQLSNLLIARNIVNDKHRDVIESVSHTAVKLVGIGLIYTTCISTSIVKYISLGLCGTIVVLDYSMPYLSDTPLAGLGQDDDPIDTIS